MKRNIIILIGLVCAGLLLWITAQEIDQTDTATKTVITKTTVTEVRVVYTDDGMLRTVTATVTRTKDDGSGVVLVKQGSRTFTRQEIMDQGVAGYTNWVNQLEKGGPNKLRTFLFNGTPLGS